MRQRLGQHFLTDRGIIRRVVDALDMTGDDQIIEIGPGSGALTAIIAARQPRSLVMIERDPRLVARLRARFPHPATIYEGDARTVLTDVVSHDVVPAFPYKIVSNTPYYLTSRLLRQLGTLAPTPARIVLIMQREVAERLTAQAPTMNKLAAIVQFWAEANYLFAVPARASTPAPDVDSAAVALVPRMLTREDGRTLSLSMEAYADLARRLFAQPRKTIGNNLIGKRAAETERGALYKALAAAEIDIHARPQTLTPLQIAILAGEISRITPS